MNQSKEGTRSQMRQHIPLPAKEVGGKRRPGEAPEYLDVYLPDHPPGHRPAAVGHGQRMILTLQVGSKRSRVLALSNLAVSWIPTEWLWGGKPVPTKGLTTFIKNRRAERHRLGVAVADEAVTDALELLAGNRVPAREETQDEGPVEASVKPDDTNTAGAGAPAANTPAAPAAGATTPAAPAAEATAPAAPAAGDTKETTMQLQTASNGKRTRKAAPAKATKKAAAKPDTKKAVSKAKAAPASTAAVDARTLKVKANAEVKAQAGKPTEIVWALVTNGMTVGELVKAAAKKSIDRGKVLSLIHRFEDLKVLTVSG